MVTSEHMYCVVKETDYMPGLLLHRCHECNICIHNYTCTCPDALIRHTICKHVHAVARHMNTNTTMMDADTTEKPIMNPEELVDCALKTVQQPRDDILKEKEAILHQLQCLQHRSQGSRKQNLFGQAIEIAPTKDVTS